MKRILLLLPVIIMSFIACKKKGDDRLAFNTWRVNGQLHKAVTVSRLPGTTFITASDGGGSTTGNSLTFLFTKEPGSGMYQVVDFPAADNEVGLLAQEGSIANIYRSKAAGAQRLQISVNNGFMNVYVPKMTLYPALPTQSATITLEANILENR